MLKVTWQNHLLTFCILNCAAAVAGQRAQLWVAAALSLQTIARWWFFAACPEEFWFKRWQIFSLHFIALWLQGPHKTGRRFSNVQLQDNGNVKNMGIEVIEKVKKHYVMERMTSGLIRCLGKSTAWLRWSSERQKAKCTEYYATLEGLSF